MYKYDEWQEVRFGCEALNRVAHTSQVCNMQITIEIKYYNSRMQWMAFYGIWIVRSCSMKLVFGVVGYADERLHVVTVRS